MMSRSSRTSRTLVIAGLTAASIAGGAASAQAASLDLKASCKYPLVGIQPVDLAIEADIPATWPLDTPTDRFPVEATLTSAGPTSIASLAANAYSLSGEATLPSTLAFPSGSTQAVAVPLTVDRWVRPDAGVPDPFVLTAKGATPSLVLDEPGTTTIALGGRFDLNLTLSDQAGVPIKVRPPVDYDPDTGLPYVDSDGNPDTFDVRCTIDGGQDLKLAEIGTATPPRDTTAPSKPSAQPSLPGDITSNSANLRWGASVDEPGGSGLSGYRIYAEEGVIDVPASATSYRVTGLADDSDYAFRITAIDAAGNESEALEVEVTIPPHGDDFGISPPTELVLVGAPTAGTVQLRWTKPARNADRVRSYNVYNGGTLIKNVVGESASITGLAASTQYTFTVEAVDFNGQRGTRSAPLLARTADPDSRPVFSFSLAGTSQLKTLTKGSLPLAGDVRADLSSATGQLSADLTLKPTQGRLIALGFLPVTAKVAFVSSGKTTGYLDEGVLTTKSLVRIKLPEVKLFGAIPLAGGNNCQTKQLSTINLKSTDRFVPTVGGSLAGTFAISDLNGCGVLNGLVSPLTAGGGNAISLKLTATSGQ